MGSNKLKIPKNFTLFATKISVVFDNKLCDKTQAYGWSYYSESKIVLSDNHGANPLSHDKIIDTFYHEKVHMILDTMSEHDLSKNEKFVDTFAKLLRQSIETETY